MDSFYEQPRRPPSSKTTPLSTEKLLPSTMPDASLLLQNQGNIPQRGRPISYKAWKLQNQAPEMSYNMSNKENVQLNANKTTQQASILRKQVRFESPSLHQLKATHNNMHAPLPPAIKQPAANFEPLTPNKILQAKPFEKMYMANIPNRNLDLSIIEPPRLVVSNTQCFEAPKMSENLPQKVVELRAERKSHPAESTRIEAPSDEPTAKDLLKIIQQQNEQIANLQKQVSTLLEQKPKIEANPFNIQLDPLNVFKNKPQFAIDLMTSFEVSIRGANNFPNRKHPTRDFYPNEEKIKEITDSEENRPLNNRNTKATDVSLTLNEPLVVQENCPSPENSIHVDMKDYSSESEDDDCSEGSIKWTLHNNVLDQVNYLLKKSHGDDGMAKTSTTKQVKDATLKHLRSIGVNLPNIEDDDDSCTETNLQFTPTEISFAVKQLLMKYLPDEQLSKLPSNNVKLKENRSEKHLIKRRPDFSLATVQYMEKYNLLKKDEGVNKAENKLLDITALKQQPKLL